MPGITSQPLVSAVIPTFNRGWTVCRAVESVLRQNYPHMEIIVVDDGSTDDTAEKLAPYAGNIRIMEQENLGVSAARNSGIKAASGDLIAFLDSDDLWQNDKISKQTAFFARHPSALICQTEEIWIRNGRRVNPAGKHKKPSGMIFEPSLHLCLVSPSAVMMKPRLFQEKGLFDETLPACEDYDLWLRISVDTPVSLIDNPGTVKHGGHDDQLSKNHSLDRYRIYAIEKLLDSRILSERQREEAVKVMKHKCRIYGNGCIKRGKEEEARRYLRMAYSSM
ncbi:MAG: glycosyltransferase family 2 protein [Desulfarculaceae bacterium]|nr:glycosyltransferase family 2 protein [Desulfarculaceae bacterium]